jgi:SAM-dependent methyltransferase
MGSIPASFPPVGTTGDLPCKICGATTENIGSVDFNKSCEEIMGTVLPRTGIQISYSACPDCGFMFTGDFDTWSKEDLRQHLYNDDYWLADPDYVKQRPNAYERWLRQLLTPEIHGHLLDYGGGNGSLSAKLRRHGFTPETYDPFNPEFSQRPSGKYDVITCFETLEHVMDPKSVLRDITSLLFEDGIIIFITMLRRIGTTDDGLGWWYVGPRNGHVSFFTAETLTLAWGELGYKFSSANPSTHIAWKNDESLLLTPRVREYFHLADADTESPQYWRT